MDFAASPERADSETDDASDVRELRSAPRFTLLIRAARIVADQGEFVCVIRDISETGVSMRLFHRLPEGERLELQMPGGAAYQIRRVWARDHEAGFEFAAPADVSSIINEASDYPKRGLRLGIQLPIEITSRTLSSAATVENLSQQGARIQCDARFAIDQALRISGGHGLEDVWAKVRWRRDNHYGVVFDDTFTLGDFARLAAQLQAPALLES
ncbi:PilZ domain-containing protein [Erythrobacter sp. GH1-10]|uniref:PilZ domain-containing protein n=1 Tax=Erythrobacter sp. GH1-10 TaxID=3349334 RepID=UPI0038783484